MDASLLRPRPLSSGYFKRLFVPVDNSDKSHSPSQPGDSGASERDGSRGGARPPSDFAELSRKIARRTTDLLAVAVLLAGGLTIGAQVMEWWNSDAAPIATSMTPPPSPWDDRGGARLEFAGADWSITRRPVEGAEVDATNALVNSCRRATADPSDVDRLPAIDESERDLLAHLGDWTPIEDTGGSRIYLIGGPLPWVVATRRDTDVSESASGAAVGERVICWGLALPQSDGRWMLYVVDRRGRNAADAGGSPRDFPLPAGVRKSMTVSSEQGGTFVCLRGEGLVAAVMPEFDKTYASAGWRTLRGWSGDGRTYAAAYESTLNGDRVVLDLTLTPAVREGWTGVADCRVESIVETE